MYLKIAVLKFKPDVVNGGAESVTLGFFDEKGICQLEVPQISGEMFPKNIKRGQGIKFCNENVVFIEDRKG